MRLTSEQVRQGLFHDDQEVRQRCLHYFTDQWSSDESVMPVVVQVIDARGRDAFDFFHRIDQLAQTDETIEWVIQSLRKTPDFFGDPDIRDFRPDILSHAKGELLLRHRDDVLSVLSGKHRESVERRMQFLSESPAALWDRMEALAKQNDSAKEWDDFPQDEMNDLVTCLGEMGSVRIERMMELLSIDVPGDDESFVMWLEPKLVRLAGLIRHEPFLPILIEKLRVDADYLNEECQKALIHLGSDEVVRTVAEQFPDEEWAWQLFASSVFEHIHSEEAIRAATALLRIDSFDEEIRQNIAHGLACQFSTEALQTLGEYLDSHDDWLDDPEWSETLPTMRAAAELLRVDEPRLKIWQAQLDEAMQSGRASLFRNMPSRFDAFNDEIETDADDEPIDDEDDFRPLPPPETVMYESPRVGRNDPCPCGSGKKFKKCCLNKLPQD